MRMEPCPDCGAHVERGREGCQELWHELSTATRILPAPAFDAYCMQHLARYCASAKSYAAHLTRLCCGMEHGSDPRVHAALQRWLNGTPRLEKPRILQDLGSLTIADVAAGTTDAERMVRATRWVESVWRAYQSQHDVARAWIAAALGGGRGAG